jgi:creatinine amidohydrolase
MTSIEKDAADRTQVWLQNLSWTDVERYLNDGGDTIILPIGSTEQHGPHLPLGTDSMVANMLAEDAALASGVLVAPPLWYGWSPHHLVLPGTVTVRAEVLIEVMYDMIASLHHHGFHKFIALNGHRIVNIIWMQIAAERAQRELKVTVKIFDPAYMSKELKELLGFGPVGHAEEIETSHMLFRHPELVRLDLAVDNPIGEPDLYSVDPLYAGDTLCYVPSTLEAMQASAAAAGGTSGTPSKSDSEKGRRYHQHLVNRLTAVIEKLREA